MVREWPSRSQVHADHWSACSTRFCLQLVQCNTLAWHHAQCIIYPPACLSHPQLQPHAACRYPDRQDKPSLLQCWAPESYGNIRTLQMQIPHTKLSWDSQTMHGYKFHFSQPPVVFVITNMSLKHGEFILMIVTPPITSNQCDIHNMDSDRGLKQSWTGGDYREYTCK